MFPVNYFHTNCNMMHVMDPLDHALVIGSFHTYKKSYTKCVPRITSLQLSHLTQFLYMSYTHAQFAQTDTRMYVT